MSRRNLISLLASGITVITMMSGCMDDVRVDLRPAGSADLEAAACASLAGSAELREGGTSGVIEIVVESAQQTITEGAISYAVVGRTIVDRVRYDWTCTATYPAGGDEMSARIDSFEKSQ